MNSAPKVRSLHDAVAWRTTQAGPVVFTNGVFDLLHVGHVSLLEAARMEGAADQTELVTVNTEEGAAYGAALLAAVGTGGFADVPGACRAAITITGRTDPGTSAATYEAGYAVYRSLYPALKPIFASLAGSSGGSPREPQHAYLRLTGPNGPSMARRSALASAVETCDGGDPDGDAKAGEDGPGRIGHRPGPVGNRRQGLGLDG